MNEKQRRNELLEEARAELKLLALKGIDPDSMEQQAMEACIRVLSARNALDAEITPEATAEFDDALEGLQRLFPSRGWSVARKFGVTAGVMFGAYGLYALLERLRKKEDQVLAGGKCEGVGMADPLLLFPKRFNKGEVGYDSFFEKFLLVW